MRLYAQSKVDGFLRDGWWTGQTLLDLLAGHVRERPDVVSLVDPANREAITDGAPRRLTWAQVDVEVRQLARSLHRIGIGPDDVVGIQLPNGVELAMAYLAVASLGAIGCPFPIQYAAHELTQMGTLAGLRAFVTVGRANKIQPARQAVGLIGRIPTLHTVLAWGDDLEQAFLHFAADAGVAR